MKKPTQSPEATVAEKPLLWNSYIQLHVLNLLLSNNHPILPPPVPKHLQTKLHVPLPSNHLLNKPLLHLLIPIFTRWIWKKLKHLFLPGVFKSPLAAKMNLFSLLKQLVFMDILTDSDFENESIDEFFSRRLTQKFGFLQMASLSNDLSQLPPFGLMDI